MLLTSRGRLTKCLLWNQCLQGWANCKELNIYRLLLLLNQQGQNDLNFLFHNNHLEIFRVFKLIQIKYFHDIFFLNDKVQRVFKNSIQGICCTALPLKLHNADLHNYGWIPLSTVFSVPMLVTLRYWENVATLSVLYFQVTKGQTARLRYK